MESRTQHTRSTERRPQTGGNSQRGVPRSTGAVGRPWELRNATAWLRQTVPPRMEYARSTGFVVLMAALCLTSCVQRATAENDHDRDRIRAVRLLQESVIKELTLDEETAGELNALFDEHYENIKSIVRETERLHNENRAMVRKLREEIETAKKARDFPEVREIRKRLRELDTGRLALRQVNMAFDVKALKLLTGEQGRTFRKLAARHRNSADARANPYAGIAAIHRRLKRLSISDEQTKEVRERMSTLATELAKAQQDAEKREQLSSDFREFVLGVLTEEQKERFLALERASTDSGRRDHKR